MTVTIELADLCEIFGTAKLYDHVQRKADALEKENAELRAKVSEYERKGSVTA